MFVYDFMYTDYWITLVYRSYEECVKAENKYSYIFIDSQYR